ncbi:uncharacterized protein LOC114538208 [Dendronephthya gigantea]|uniref:uncharacterized protein LOC114538208 n=1 Tax=Dendronephthya gigantea TaxID=151771 RepID=UPI00106CC345|nr:uncharacterized protein LOC114538208 [Dendronephthya gigantea]
MATFVLIRRPRVVTRCLETTRRGQFWINPSRGRSQQVSASGNSSTTDSFTVKGQPSHVHLKPECSKAALSVKAAGKWTPSQGNTYEECATCVIAALKQFDELGFVVHPEKSAFNPSQIIMVLGFIINSVDMTVTLTDEKRTDITNMCDTVLNSRKIKIRDLAQLIGKLIASFPGVVHGPLYYRSLEADKTKALRISKGNFDDTMGLSENSRLELRWWLANISHVHNVISHKLPSCTLTTDASLSGWGAVFQTSKTGGTWGEGEKHHHINYLELLALYLGLQTYCSSLNDTHVRVRLDNTTAVAVINHMGTSHSAQCNALGKEIWEWCIMRNIWLSAAHVPGIENTEADFESRQKQSNTEWMLNHKRLHEALLKLDFVANVDVFASRLNTQFPSYISYRPDPGAKAVDVFLLTYPK